MSREIKFRAYWKEEKRLCKVHSLHFGTRKAMLTLILESDTRAIRPEGQGSEHEISKGVISVPFGDTILEQYTGLKDKNGKEIYEGDIVKMTCRVAKDESTLYKVIWNELLAGYDLINLERSKDDVGCLTIYVRENYKVVGNIHENLELLGGGNEKD